jgi:hypothetical protein
MPRTEVAERKRRFDKTELAQEWDKIQRRERQALIPTNILLIIIEFALSVTVSFEFDDGCCFL